MMTSSDEYNQYLALVRAALADAPADGTETTDDLRLILSEEGEPLSEGDADLLELATTAIQRGDDLQRAFPRFYQRLQRNPALREAFLEILEMMEQEDE